METTGQRSAALLDTFPKLLLDHLKNRPDRPAIREKGFGIWQSWSWGEYAAEVRAFACGLAAKGFKRGDKLGIIGDNRPRLYWAAAATQALGGIPVPLYQDAVAEEMVFVIDNAEIRFVVVEDQEQVDKLLDMRERIPRVELIIYDEPRGLGHYDFPFLDSYEEVQGLGKIFDQEHPDFFLKEVAQGAGSDIAAILYTSGTTGQPKGVVLTYDNLMMTSRNAIESERIQPDEEVLSYLPMAWIGDHLFSYCQAHIAGYCVNCPESAETMLTDLREIGITYYLAPPRVYENLLTSVMIRMEDAAWLKRAMFRYFMRVARRVGVAILDRKPVSLMDRLLYAIGSFLVYEPLKNVLGFSRMRLAITGGEAIGPDLFAFFRSLGVNIKQLYGATEASAFVTVQPDGEVNAITVGKPVPGVEIKITEAGEVIVRSPGVFHSYYKNPQATQEAKNDEGWLLTGDAGFFDDSGHLRIIDRAKDVGRLNNGNMFAPKFLENKLKFFPYIKEAVTFGNGRDEVTAFINIDITAVGNWAERRNLPYSGYTDLAGKPEVSALVKECVEQVNRDLAADSHLSGSQIKRFLILHKELDADDGELTRTRKVRRRSIAEKYGVLIEALYSGKDHCPIETQVKFEDGRVGTVKADLKIVDVRIFTPEELKQAS